MVLTSGNSNNYPVAETKPSELQTGSRVRSMKAQVKRGAQEAKRNLRSHTKHPAQSLQLKGRLMEAVIRKIPKNYNTCLQRLTAAVHKLTLSLH